MDLNAWVESLKTAARGVSDWTGSAFWNGVNEWRRTFASIVDAKAALAKHPPAATSDAVVKSEYSSLTSRMATLYERARWIDDRVDEIANGVARASGLGAVPLIPAAIVAGIAAVTYLAKAIIDEITRYVRERQYVTAAMASGRTELQAMAEFQRNNPAGGGLFGDASKLVWPLAIVGGLYLLIKERGFK